MFINYRLADGTYAQVEVTDEVGRFILDSYRKERNADRLQRKYCPYHIEATEYEGEDYADPHMTPEEILIRKEEMQEAREKVDSKVLPQLTDTQLRRMVLKANGLTVRQIAAAEHTSVNAVQESLEAAKKKFQK
jgi:hypothetical protein